MGDARTEATLEMATTQTASRGRLTFALWSLMWLTWLGFVAQQAADVERFSGTWDFLADMKLAGAITCSSTWCSIF